MALKWAERWLEKVWRTPIKPAGRKLVMVCLADHAHNRKGTAYPGVARIARRTNLSQRQVIRYLKELEADGFITRKRRPDGRGGLTSSLTTLNEFALSGSQDVPVDNSVDILVSYDLPNVTCTTVPPLTWMSGEELLNLTGSYSSRGSGQVASVRVSYSSDVPPMGAPLRPCSEKERQDDKQNLTLPKFLPYHLL